MITVRKYSWLFEKPFKSLINVILCNDNTKSCEFMKKYLLGQWYVGYNNMVWYGMVWYGMV
ncbi:DUF1911 domain-containing protein [Bacillus cereus]|nr:DUF1911 domain-containing protein [Bacillus cereus]